MSSNYAKSNQKRTIIGACEYSIQAISLLKKDLQNLDTANPDLNWAIGGIVATLVANLIQTCEKVFIESAKAGDSNGKTDLNEIKNKFGDFIDSMINPE